MAVCYVIYDEGNGLALGIFTTLKYAMKAWLKSNFDQKHHKTNVIYEVTLDESSVTPFSTLDYEQRWEYVQDNDAWKTSWKK
jgi:hypothetical protein